MGGVVNLLGEDSFVVLARTSKLIEALGGSTLTDTGDPMEAPGEISILTLLRLIERALIGADNRYWISSHFQP